MSLAGRYDNPAGSQLYPLVRDYEFSYRSAVIRTGLSEWGYTEEGIFRKTGKFCNLPRVQNCAIVRTLYPPSPPPLLGSKETLKGHIQTKKTKILCRLLSIVHK